jgi:serine/threonine protein kinase
MSQIGVVLGTAAYMSPEQAKGRVVDKRSDVWAFGCVLYEMLTARRAFASDVAAPASSVLKDEPDWQALPADLPDSIHTLLARCLATDRRQRIARHVDPDLRVRRDGPHVAERKAWPLVLVCVGRTWLQQLCG